MSRKGEERGNKRERGNLLEGFNSFLSLEEVNDIHFRDTD